MANFSGTALFVTADAGTLNTADTEMKDRLSDNGYTVTLKSDEDSFLDTDSNWETFDVAVVSESVSSSTLGTSGRDAVVGVVMLEPGDLDDWDLASNAGISIDEAECEPVAIFDWMGGFAGSSTKNNQTIATEDKGLAYMTNPSSGADQGFISNEATTRSTMSGWELGATLTTGTAADRRVWIGWFRIDTGLPGGGNEATGGFVVNDNGWAMFDSAVEWVKGDLLTTDRQVAVADDEITATGGWTGTVTNIDDTVTVTTTSPYDSTNASGVLVVALGDLTDPVGTALHTVAIASRHSTGAGSGAVTYELYQTYVSEGSKGTLIASTTGYLDAQTAWGGDVIQLTPTEADNITDYTDLFVRVDYTVATTSEMEIANIRFLVDGGVAVAATVYPPFPRRQNTLVRM